MELLILPSLASEDFNDFPVSRVRIPQREAVFGENSARPPDEWGSADILHEGEGYGVAALAVCPTHGHRASHGIARELVMHGPRDASVRSENHLATGTHEGWGKHSAAAGPGEQPSTLCST